MEAVALGPLELTPRPEEAPTEGDGASDAYFREPMLAARDLKGAGLAMLGQNVQRYLWFTKMKLGFLYQALRSKDRATFSVIPYLLHTNQPGLPGYDASGEGTFGIQDFEYNQTIRSAVDSLFAGRTGRTRAALHQPVVQSLLAMGSVGTIGQSGKSDVDYWVVVNEPTLSASARDRLLDRIEAIETWAQKRGLDAHFFLVDIERTRQNDFSGSGEDVDSSGSAQGKLLKEEFYRTAIFISGALPLWWVAPSGVDEHGYKRVVDAINRSSSVRGLSFVDLGFIGTLDHGEFFGAALWQINKSLRSPFKSLLKMALLVRYLDAEHPVLLCDQLKERVFAGEQSPQFTDPYVVLFDAISEYFAERKDWKAFRLIQKCFYLKVGLKLSRQRVERPQFMRRFRVMKAYIARWGWDEALIAELDSLDSWSAEKVDGMGQAIRAFMLDLYRLLVDKARGATVSINENDITILGRRLFAAFGQDPGKIQHLFTYFLDSPRTEDRLVVLEALDADPARRWEVHRHVKRGQTAQRDEPIWAGSTLAEIGAWLAFNGLFYSGTVVGLISRSGQATTSQFRNMLERFLTIFECPDPFSIRPLVFLEPRRARRVALVVNFDVPKKLSDFTQQAGVFFLPENWDILNYGRKRESQLVDISLVTLNSWGEVHCKRYQGMTALPVALRALYESIDPNHPLEEVPVVFAPPDRTLPAIRNRLGELLSRADEVFMGVLAARESRTFVYEVGGRFQILHRSADGRRICGARSLRGVARLLGNAGYDQQQIAVDKLSPSLGDLRALLERHTGDREAQVYIGWRRLRDRGIIIICDETRRIYRRQTLPGALDKTIVLLTRRILHHLRGHVANAKALRRALRIFEIREGRALGGRSILADDTMRVLGQIAQASSGHTVLTLCGKIGRGRQGLGLTVGETSYMPDEFGRAFIVQTVRRIMEARSPYDTDAFLIDASDVDFGRFHRSGRYDPGVVKHLRLIDMFEVQLRRALKVYRGETSVHLSSARAFSEVLP